jgi:hypothetical protein
MADSFYNADYTPDKATIDGVRQFVVSENEVAFDAADFTRCGKDIFVQKSNVTNAMGIEWVRRHIGPEFTIHEVEFGDEHPMHIDTTIVPLGPGKLMINPAWVTREQIPGIFDSWEIIEAPEPVKPYDSALYFSSDWLTMNFLSVDEKRIIVEENEAPLIKLLEQHGFEPIPIPFRNFYPFGGSIHCALPPSFLYFPCIVLHEPETCKSSTGSLKPPMKKSNRLRKNTETSLKMPPKASSKLHGMENPLPQIRRWPGSWVLKTVGNCLPKLTIFPARFMLTRTTGKSWAVN